MILTQYCHQLGNRCDLKAVISVSSVLDCFLSKKSLEESWINYTLYAKFLAGHLCNLIRRYTNLHIVLCDYPSKIVSFHYTETPMIYSMRCQSVLISHVCYE